MRVGCRGRPELPGRVRFPSGPRPQGRHRGERYAPPPTRRGAGSPLSCRRARGLLVLGHAVDADDEVVDGPRRPARGRDRRRPRGNDARSGGADLRHHDDRPASRHGPRSITGRHVPPRDQMASGPAALNNLGGLLSDDDDAITRPRRIASSPSNEARGKPDPAAGIGRFAHHRPDRAPSTKRSRAHCREPAAWPEPTIRDPSGAPPDSCIPGRAGPMLRSVGDSP